MGLKNKSKKQRYFLRKYIFSENNLKFKMGVFKRISSEGGEEFLKMFTQDAEKVQKALGAELTTEVTDNGDTVVIKRTWTAGGQSKSQENTIKCGQESELTGPLGTSYKAVVSVTVINLPLTLMASTLLWNSPMENLLRLTRPREKHLFASARNNNSAILN